VGRLNGAVGVVVAARGRLFVVLSFTVARGKIVEIDVVADPSCSASSTWWSSTTDAPTPLRLGQLREFRARRLGHRRPSNAERTPRPIRTARRALDSAAHVTPVEEAADRRHCQGLDDEPHQRQCREGRAEQHRGGEHALVPRRKLRENAREEDSFGLPRLLTMPCRNATGGGSRTRTPPSISRA
jgi:hypothetical protein